MQETDFPFEVIIAEDCSTDSTREIVRTYQRQHPELIRTLLPEHNLGRGGLPLLTAALKLSRGAYIALLEGDDCWSSPHKLQRQRDFLHAHPSYSACFHNALVVREDGSRPPRPYNPDQQALSLTLEHLWKRNPIATCTAMLRRDVIDGLPSWYQTSPWGDWPLHMLSASYGPIGYLPDMMGVYRIHARGYWSERDKVTQHTEIIAFLQKMCANFGHRYSEHAQAGIVYHRIQLAGACAAVGELRSAGHSLRRGVREGLVSRRVSVPQLVIMLIQVFLPRVHRLMARVRNTGINRLAVHTRS